MAVSTIKYIRDVIHKTYTVTLTANSGVAPWTRFGSLTIDSIDGYVPVLCFAKTGNSVQRALANLYGLNLVVYGMNDLSSSVVEVLYYKI